jgi:hypothetical protein
MRKLNSTEQTDFSAALQHYYSSNDAEMQATFFWAAAKALIDAHESGETIVAPLRLWSRESVFVVN